MASRGMNRDLSVIFEIAPRYCILDSFVDYEGYSISSNGCLFTLVDIMVSSVQSLGHVRLFATPWTAPSPTPGVYSNSRPLSQ